MATGRRSGVAEATEPIPVSRANALWMLAMNYGVPVAESMLFRADGGQYVFGPKVELPGEEGKKLRAGWNVAAHKAEPGCYVLQAIALIQNGKVQP